MSEDWPAVHRLLTSALELETGDRSAFVERSCAGDSGLRRAVQQRLALADLTDGFLAEPLLGQGKRASPFALDPGPSRSAPKGAFPEGRLGPYAVEKELGSGGMGTVYLARRDDQLYQGKVAIKVLHETLSDSTLPRRFRKEIQILADLDHPNIVKLLDAGTHDDGRLFFVMEWVRGEPIDRYCARHDLDLETRIDLMIKVCQAVQHAHRNLVVHRDLKPGNILVTEDGEPKLLDFGIAKLLRQEHSDLTLHGWQVMTPSYASPEQFFGVNVTTSADIYSLGVILYQLLCGTLPRRPSGVTLVELASSFDEEPDPPSETLRRHDGEASGIKRLAGDLDAITLMAIQREPKQRYPTVEKLAGDLASYRSGQPVAARADVGRYRVVKMMKRHRWATLTLILVFTLLVATTSVVTSMTITLNRQNGQLENERDVARRLLDFVVDTMIEANNPWLPKLDSEIVRKTLEQGTEQAVTLFGNHPEVQARLFAKLGYSYIASGDDASAEPLLLAALRVQEETLPPDHPDLASSRHAYGRLLNNQGRFEEAVVQFQRALEVHRANLAENEFSGIETATHLAFLYYRLVRFDEAEALIDQTLEELSSSQTYGRQRLRRILGLIEAGRHQWEAAEARFRRLADWHAETLTPRHPEYALALEDLARVQSRRGKRAEAESNLRLALEILEESLRPHHRRMGYLLHLLATHSLNYGDAPGALTWIKRLRDDIVPNLPESALLHGGAFSVEARYWKLLGCQDAAMEFFEQTREAYARALSSDHQVSLIASSNLAASLTGLGRWRRAEAIYRREIDRLEATGLTESDHAEVRIALARLHHGLGRVRAWGNRTELARGHWLRALELVEPFVEQDGALDTLALKAASLLALGRSGEATPVLARLREVGWSDPPLEIGLKPPNRSCAGRDPVMAAS